MDVWFNAAEMHLTDFYRYPNSSYNYILDNAYTEALLGPRTFVSLLNSTRLSTARRDELLAGAPFDARNESTARVFYTVADYDDRFWVYNYNLFYSWSGCSNQAVTVSGNGTTEDYLLCPAGVHEADLERVSVLVCKSGRTMKQVAYSQHSWTEVRNCEHGQCPLAAGTGNPVVYAGLESHANYPTSSPLMVYDYRNATATEKVSIANFGGIWFGDRTLANPYLRFVPSPENIVYLPTLEVIASQNLTGFSWAQYTGNWGAPLQAPQPALYCLNDNGTALDKCPTNTTLEITVAEMLNLLNLVPWDENLQYSDGADYTVQELSKGSLVQYPNNTGPLLRAYSYTWDTNSSAPIYQQQSNASTLVCPQDVQVLQSIPKVATPTTSISTIVDLFVWLAVGDVAFSFLLSLLFAFPVLLDKTARIHRMAVRKMASMSQFTLADALHAVNKAPGVAIKAVKAAPDAVAGEAAAWVEKLGGNNSIPGGQWQNATEAGLAQPPEAEGGDEEQARPGFQQRPEAASEASFRSAVTEVMELEAIAVEAFNVRVFIWTTLAAALYIAGVVLLGIGIQQLVTASIISAALNVSQSGSVAGTVQSVLAGLLALIGVADICVIVLLLCLSPRHLRLGKLRVRNYLGGHAWPLRSSFGIHVALISIMALVINAACIFVTLGFFVVITQLGARIACEKIGSVQALGVGASDVCIFLPSLVDGQICGWQALQTCYSVTSMRVAYIVLGAIMQLWCHLIWLIVLVGSLERSRTQVAVIRPGRHSKDGPNDNVG